ncbi:MAG: hypothetical protein ACJAWO_001083 [Halieaceae bacterium]|jgi:hypothetical protein
MSIALVSVGQESIDTEAAALAKATQNPLAAMYSLPFQNNTTYRVGEFNRVQNVLNVQPVIPVSFKKFNLINRLIVPVITQPSTIENTSTTGLGDISYTAWLSPTKPSSVTWGVGPAVQLPTASSNEFGSGEFGVGPSVVALTSVKQWVVGVVVNNVWTFGEVSENKLLFQYFVNYNLPKAWYLVSAPIMTANWNAVNDKWTVPIGAGAGKVFKLGGQPINVNAQVYYNAQKPANVGDWQSRVQVQFLFPKKK